jgi:hypothetical protein
MEIVTGEAERKLGRLGFNKETASELCPGEHAIHRQRKTCLSRRAPVPNVLADQSDQSERSPIQLSCCLVAGT